MGMFFPVPVERVGRLAIHRGKVGRKRTEAHCFRLGPWEPTPERAKPSGFPYLNPSNILLLIGRHRAPMEAFGIHA